MQKNSIIPRIYHFSSHSSNNLAKTGRGCFITTNNHSSFKLTKLTSRRDLSCSSLSEELTSNPFCYRPLITNNKPVVYRNSFSPRNYSTVLRSCKMVATGTQNGSLLNGKNEQSMKNGGNIVDNKWRHTFSVPNGDLSAEDTTVYDIMLKEKHRQRNEIELIASENFASKSVLQVSFGFLLFLR